MKCRALSFAMLINVECCAILVMVFSSFLMEILFSKEFPERQLEFRSANCIYISFSEVKKHETTERRTKSSEEAKTKLNFMKHSYVVTTGKVYDIQASSSSNANLLKSLAL